MECWGGCEGWGWMRGWEWGVRECLGMGASS